MNGFHVTQFYENLSADLHFIANNDNIKTITDKIIVFLFDKTLSLLYNIFGIKYIKKRGVFYEKIIINFNDFS